MILTKEDIKMVELELTSSCNLECPLCIRSNFNFKHVIKPHQRSLQEIINQLDEYKNLTDVCIAGIMSEPTYYKELIHLLLYLESRNIETELYVNGNTMTQDWWYNLGKILKCTKVIFTICGSTQELHETYRVNSNLEEIYINAAAFKRSGNCNDYIQIIKFNYNEEDIKINFQKIIRDFTNIITINSLPYQERFNIDSEIKMTNNLSSFYKRLKNASINRMSSNEIKINCKSNQTKFISIDQFGNIFPCFLYKLYCNKEFNFDYSDILKSKYDFCFECEKITTALIESNGLERMA